MKYGAVACILAALLVAACDGGRPTGENRKLEDVLIDEGFMDANRYRIVCRGFPRGDLQGYARTLSSQKAAELNALFVAGLRFPGLEGISRYGTTEKIVQEGDVAVIHYRIEKNALRNDYRP